MLKACTLVQGEAVLNSAAAAMGNMLESSGWEGHALRNDVTFKKERKAARLLAQQRVKKRCAAESMLCYTYAVH